MRSSVVLAALVAALCAVQPAAAFLQDLLLQPLQAVQHAVQPQWQQPAPQYYHYSQQQYRRSSEPQTPAVPLQQGVYSSPRPVVYQWQPNSYGSAYSYSSNPLSSLLQNSWFPWSSSGRQPLQAQPQTQPLQAQQLQAQQLQAQQLQAQPQQPSAPAAPAQQPLQAFWAFLPWNNAGGASQQQPGPILSFLQNPSAVLPWGQQGGRPSGVVYTTPLAPSPPAPSHAASLTAAPVAAEVQVVSEAVPASGVKSVSVGATGLVLDAAPTSADFTGNGVRRIALHDVHTDEVPCAHDA